MNNSFHQEKLEFHPVYELAFADKLRYIRIPVYIQNSDSLNKLEYLQRSHLILSWISSIQVQLEFGDVGLFSRRGIVKVFEGKSSMEGDDQQQTPLAYDMASGDRF